MLELLNHIADFLRAALVKELEDQGHVATGNLLKSIEVVVEEIKDGFEIKGNFLKYGRYVDTGRKPGGKKVPIAALIDWIRVKKIDLRGKSERSVAFAIQTAIFRKGIPTDGDTSKKRWMSRTLEANEEELIKQLRQAAFTNLSLLFSNLIENTQKELNENNLAA